MEKAVGAVDLEATFESDQLLELRTGRMKKLPGLEVLSGIDKGVRSGSLWLGKLGFEEDEHDPTFHGGPEKSVLSCSWHDCQGLRGKVMGADVRDRLFFALCWLEARISGSSRQICSWWIRRELRDGSYE